MFKKFYTLVVFTILSSWGIFAQTVNSIPEKIQDGNILHCFNWSIKEVTANLNDIAEAGFGAVQLSPLQRPSAKPEDSWSALYRPYDLSFQASDAMGSEEDLKELCSEADKLGIKVIVDVVANHVDKADGCHDLWWEQGSQARVRYWGNPVCNDYSNREQITTYCIGDYAGEVNTEAIAVLQKIRSYLTKLQNCGVKGIRWDAAKHIGLPSENSDFWKIVTEEYPGLYHYGEILDSPRSSDYKELLKEYGDYIVVTDTRFSNEAAQSNNGIPMRKNGEYAAWVGADKVLYWAESHDTYSNTRAYGGWSTTVEQSVINRAYASIACRDGATALYLARPGSTVLSEIKLGKSSSPEQDNEGFLSTVVTEVNKFRNLMNGRAEYFSVSEDGKAVSITRYNGGAVIITEPNADFTVPNGGAYCPVPPTAGGRIRDKVSGENMITVTKETISGKAGETGVVIIYMNTLGEIQGDDFIGQPYEDTDVTIYYDNTETNWDSVYCHYWGGANTSKFPGVQMEATDNDGIRENLYIVTVPVGSQVVFSDGGSPAKQTVDSEGAVVANHVYRGLSDLSGNKNLLFDTGVYGEQANEPFRVYYDNSETKYSPVNCHYWGGTSSTNMPGKAMTWIKDDIYTIILPEGTEGILFAQVTNIQTVNVNNPQPGYLYKGLKETNDRGRNEVEDKGLYENEEEETPREFTIYYDNTYTKYAEPVKCSYDGASSKLYPGVDMEPVEGHIFKITIPTDISYVIFNGPRGAGQTVNVTSILDNHIYLGTEQLDGRNRNFVEDKQLYSEYTPIIELKYFFGDDRKKAWSNKGTAFDGIMSMEIVCDYGLELELEKINIDFEPIGVEDWVNVSETKPEGIEDAEWKEWNALTSEGQYVDGFWDETKVAVNIVEDSYSDDYTVLAKLPCSGLYQASVSSANYSLIPQEEEPAVFEVYPSLKNLWFSNSFMSGNEYIPLCTNINGVPLNYTNQGIATDLKMDYPFIDGYVHQWSTLDKSVLYTTGVYLADVWTKAEKKASGYYAGKRRADVSSDIDIPEGYNKTNVLDLSDLSSEDGKEAGSTYEVHVIMTKNGAVMPLEAGGQSTEYFTVSASKTTPIPTGIKDINATPYYEEVEAIYNINGIKINKKSNNLAPGVYIRVKGNKVEKMLVE